jgi:hypothetical protein
MDTRGLEAFPTHSQQHSSVMYKLGVHEALATYQDSRTADRKAGGGAERWVDGGGVRSDVKN